MNVFVNISIWKLNGNEEGVLKLSFWISWHFLEVWEGHDVNILRNRFLLKENLHVISVDVLNREHAVVIRVLLCELEVFLKHSIDLVMLKDSGIYDWFSLFILLSCWLIQILH